MTHPYRLLVDAPRNSAAPPPMTAGERKSLRSPLKRPVFVENAVAGSITGVPCDRFRPRPYILARVGMIEPDAIAAASEAAVEGDQEVTFLAAFGAQRSGSINLLRLVNDWPAHTARGYQLSSIPLGEEAWFPFALNPAEGAGGAAWGDATAPAERFSFPVRWCRATVVGTPSRMRVRGLDVSTAALAVLLPASAADLALPATLAATTDAAGGNPVRFTGGDGVPLDADGVAAEVGSLFLSALAPGGVFGGRPLAVFDGSARVAKVLRAGLL